MRVRVGAGLVALGAIPVLLPSSLAGSAAANSPVVELAAGLLMLAGAAVLAVALWRDVTATDSDEAGDVSG